MGLALQDVVDNIWGISTGYSQTALNYVLLQSVAWQHKSARMHFLLTSANFTLIRIITFNG